METLLRQLPDDEPRPLGQWLVDDLLIAAEQRSNQVLRRGAERVGIPETTYRRRLTKAKRRLRQEPEARLAHWDKVRTELDQLTETADGRDLPVALERVLLEKIIQCHPNDTTRGSKLLGTSAPTYRRRVAALAFTPQL